MHSVPKSQKGLKQLSICNGKMQEPRLTEIPFICISAILGPVSCAFRILSFLGRTDAEAETPYFGHLIRRTDSLGKTLMLGKIEGRRRKG